MWNLGEYRKHPQRLADHLPWATFIAPGVMLNKDGSLQKTIAFRGPDLDSSTPYELVAARARMNNVLRRLGSHWCVHVEASRRLAHVYPASDFPNPVAAMIDQERRESFTADSQHFESQCYITFTYLPPAEGMTRLGDFFIDRPNNKVEGRVSYRAHFDHFIGQVDQIVNLMASFMPEVHPVDDGETLTYLHSCISDRRLTVAVPDVPFYLDEMITDRPLAGGLSPRLGRLFLKTVSIRAYVNRTLPCLLDRLNELPIEYRWIGRYLPMDKTDSTRRLNKLRRQWFAKRKGMVTLLKEAITKQESKLEDSDSLNKSDDVDAALQELGGDHCSFGDFTLTITVWDEDEQTATEKARAVQQVVDGVGLVTEIEDFNAVQAWMGSLPGHAYADVRRPLVSSLNVCDLVPLSAVWSGPARCGHLNGPPLLVTRTKGSTPFRLSLHQGDVGHTIIAGPTGAGKSTLLNLIACQWLRYPNARVYIFDKGASCRAMTLAMGGDFYDLGGEGEEICFQPLAGIDDESELAWAQEWVADLLHREKVEVTPTTKQELWAALSNLASMPRTQRTLSTLLGLVQDADVRQAMRSYTLDGPHGRLLDANHDTLGDGDVERGARWQAFEMEHLMHSRSVLLPVLTYLFRRLEKRFDGSPTLMILDEAWLYLTESLFAAKIREWLKVLRKKNVAVIFATQSLSDIADSPIAPAIIENCPTRIFLPNGNALEERTRKVYESFGLNERQLQILQQSIPKKDYYYQSREGNRLFELGLGELALAFCAAGSPQDQARISHVLNENGRARFARAYLNERGLGHWADHLETLLTERIDHEQLKLEFDGKLDEKFPLLRRKGLAALLLATGTAMVLLPARRADAFLFDIVLDPVALVENILKVVDIGEQIDAVVQQVENQVKELEHLGSNVAPNISAVITGVEGQLDSSLYSTSSPASQLDSRYPADMSNSTWAQYQSDQSNWTDDQRQSLVENRQLQNQVYQDMDTATQQVKTIVDASNLASGETSAIQAHNDLLAVASAEFAKLQSLRLARSRLRTEKLAQQQSELSYAEAERQRVRSGWDNPAPPTQTVVDPFQN